jgi:hypothetical protein
MWGSCPSIRATTYASCSATWWLDTLTLAGTAGGTKGTHPARWEVHVCPIPVGHERRGCDGVTSSVTVCVLPGCLPLFVLAVALLPPRLAATAVILPGVALVGSRARNMLAVADEVVNPRLVEVVEVVVLVAPALVLLEPCALAEAEAGCCPDVPCC